MAKTATKPTVAANSTVNSRAAKARTKAAISTPPTPKARTPRAPAKAPGTHTSRAKTNLANAGAAIQNEAEMDGMRSIPDVALSLPPDPPPGSFAVEGEAAAEAMLQDAEASAESMLTAMNSAVVPPPMHLYQVYFMTGVKEFWRCNGFQYAESGALVLFLQTDTGLEPMALFSPESWVRIAMCNDETRAEMGRVPMEQLAADLGQPTPRKGRSQAIHNTQ